MLFERNSATELDELADHGEMAAEDAGQHVEQPRGETEVRAPPVTGVPAPPGPAASSSVPRHSVILNLHENENHAEELGGLEENTNVDNEQNDYCVEEVVDENDELNEVVAPVSPGRT